MKDGYERVIDYVRISVTDRCNLRCVYCMPEEGVVSVPHERILSYDEIVHLCHVFARLGVTKIKLTGGEPLVRKNIGALISDIKNISEIEEVTLTTNGILLEQQAETLVAAGIDGINVSLDTLNAVDYARITRGGDIHAVIKGIHKMMQYPEVRMKINCVPNDISDNEVIEIAKLAENHTIHVRFIELMPIGMGKKLVSDEVKKYDQETRIKKILEQQYGTIQQYHKTLGNGPSTYYTIEGFQGKIGFISAMSHKFCDNCNRIRVSAEGYLKTCLQYDIGEDLFDLLRNNGSDRDLENRILKAIHKKPKAHEFLEDFRTDSEQKNMSQIGG